MSTPGILSWLRCALNTFWNKADFNSELIHLLAIPGGGGPPPDPPPFIEMPSCLWEHMLNPKDIRGGLPSWYTFELL